MRSQAGLFAWISLAVVVCRASVRFWEGRPGNARLRVIIILPSGLLRLRPFGLGRSLNVRH